MMSKKVRASKTRVVKGLRPRGSSTRRKEWQFPARPTNTKVILHSLLPKYSLEFFGYLVDDVVGLITSLVRNHGFNDGPARYNIMKNYTIALLEKRNPENPGWLATSRKYRIPSGFGELFSKLMVDYFECTDEVLLPKYYQCILTILNLSRLVEGLVDADFSAITEPCKPIDPMLIAEFDKFVESELKGHKYSRPEVNLFDVRFNVKKNGPNGVPKVESALSEAICLVKSTMFSPFRRICDELNCTYLVEYLVALESQFSQQEEYANIDGVKLRKVVKIADQGFKTRVVAIADFWSQLILNPIRDHVRETISKKFGKTDFRLNQDGGVAAMVDFQKQCLTGVSTFNGIELKPEGLKFYDISSWTDRFHRDLQKVVMKHLFTPRLAENWAQLTVHCSWYSPNLKQYIKYGQGQGMGTNGSFEIATLTDHLLILYVFKKVYQNKALLPGFECYGKVGDDLWIYDPEDQLPPIYEKINLPINMSKSKTFCELGSVAEFCSRTFLNGIDVSRINPGITNRAKDYRYLPMLISLCANRGVQLSCSSFEFLQRKLKNSEETYLDLLQSWIISLLVLGKYEETLYFKSMTKDYLASGGWITSSRLNDFLDDPNLSSRLLICHSIMKIAKAKEDIKSKIFENVEAMEDWGDEITDISSDESNLFDQSNFAVEVALSALPKQTLLTPKQIIVLGRYKDQRKLVTEQLDIVEQDSWSIREPKDLLRFAEGLERIASRCCYDEGNLKYDHKRVYTTQFEIVNLLKRGNEDLTVFTLDSSEDLREVLQEVRYDKLYEKWEGNLPTLDVEPC